MLRPCFRIPASRKCRNAIRRGVRMLSASAVGKTGPAARLGCAAGSPGSRSHYCPSVIIARAAVFGRVHDVLSIRPGLGSRVRGSTSTGHGSGLTGDTPRHFFQSSGPGATGPVLLSSDLTRRHWSRRRQRRVKLRQPRHTGSLSAWECYYRLVETETARGDVGVS